MRTEYRQRAVVRSCCIADLHSHCMSRMNFGLGCVSPIVLLSPTKSLFQALGQLYKLRERKRYICKRNCRSEMEWSGTRPLLTLERYSPKRCTVCTCSRFF